jgi:hypothetical protein
MQEQSWLWDMVCVCFKGRIDLCMDAELQGFVKGLFKTEIKGFRCNQET